MKLINKITVSHTTHFPADTKGIPGLAKSLEKAGDCIATPGRILLAREYTLQKLPNGNLILKSPERFSPLAKIAAVVLFPLTLIATLFGLALKAMAHKMYPELANKYSLPTLLNAREQANFGGKLPKNSLFPNCVNTQQKSIWGKLYEAEPITIPQHVTDPIGSLKKALATVNQPGLKASNFELVEEDSHYLHYTYTVDIPSGPLKGTYIDDVDIYYNVEKRCFEIRSASRLGFRDAVHANFKLPGANKKRIEAIREAFQETWFENKKGQKETAPVNSQSEKTAHSEPGKSPSAESIPQVLKKEVLPETPHVAVAPAPSPAISTACSLQGLAEPKQTASVSLATTETSYRPIQTSAPVYFVRERRVQYAHLVDQIYIRTKMLMEAKANFPYSEKDLIAFLKRKHFIDPSTKAPDEKAFHFQGKRSSVLEQICSMVELLLDNVEEDKRAFDHLKGKIHEHRGKGERFKFAHYIHSHLVNCHNYLAYNIEKNCFLTANEQAAFHKVLQKLKQAYISVIRWK